MSQSVTTNNNKNVLPPSSSPPHHRSLVTEFLLGGFSTMSAALFTNPIEVVKTRMQVQGELVRLGKVDRVYSNAFQAFYLIGKQEGVRGLQGGLGPAILYQLMMNGTRLGFYEPIKRFYTNDGKNPSTLKNIAAGSTSGVIAAVMGSPFFLIKVRLQVQQSSGNKTSSTPTVGFQHSYKGALSGLKEIAQTEGIRGLYRGATAAMLRVGVGSGVQLSCYDACKSFVVSLSPNTFTNSSVSTHFAASMVSGLFVTLAMNPFDVISTRMYNQPVVNGRNAVYSNVFDCAVKIARAEGPIGFYKGFVPHFLRLGPHTILTFIFWEQLKIIATKMGY